VAGRHMVLPQGGIGPLTAQATSVWYAEEPHFEVEYLSAGDLNNVRFALEQAYNMSSRERDGETLQVTDLPIPDNLDEEDGEGGEDPHDVRARRRDALAQRARLLIRGNQFGDGDTAYLVDGLRVALGAEPRSGTTVTTEDL